MTKSMRYKEQGYRYMPYITTLNLTEIIFCRYHYGQAFVHSHRYIFQINVNKVHFSPVRQIFSNNI